MSHNYGDLYERGYIDGLYSIPPMVGIQGEYSQGFLDGSEDRMNYYSWRQYEPGNQIENGKWDELASTFFLTGDIITKSGDDWIFDPLCLREGRYYQFKEKEHYFAHWTEIKVEQRELVCAILDETDEREA